ncbi:MAG: FkbM family methyltransferase [Parvularculaceae bacterium]|nr:FkbM family methyltransferase [Parvularculaceae bacterium]
MISRFRRVTSRRAVPIAALVVHRNSLVQLSAIQRLKLLRQDLLAALHIGGNVPIAVRQTPDGWVVEVDARRIAVPSPLRWKLYRLGWEARLDRLAREYGIGRHVALTNESVVLDVGANAGEFAHVCARYGARVFCFEPDPAVFASLTRNLADLPNASAHDMVIWKEDGAVDFGLAPERADSSVFAKGPRIQKRALTIESFARENALTHVDLIKCDAEGAEPEVLEGIGSFFPRVRAVALDTGAERNGARTHDDCRTILEREGFHVIDEKVGTRWMTYGRRDQPQR